MHVLEFIDYQIVPTEEAFLIKPIRDLYNKDKSKAKETFLQQLSIIYFMADPRSSYNYILDDNERLKEILVQEGLGENYVLSDDIKKAIECYKKHTITASSELLEDAKFAVANVRKFLREVDLAAVDSKGKPLYTVSAITTALKQLPELAKNIIETEHLVTKEIEETGRARGGNTNKTLTDDGLSNFI